MAPGKRACSRAWFSRPPEIHKRSLHSEVVRPRPPTCAPLSLKVPGGQMVNVGGFDRDRRRYNTVLIETRAQQGHMLNPVQKRHDRCAPKTIRWNRTQGGNELVCLHGYPEHICTPA